MANSGALAAVAGDVERIGSTLNTARSAAFPQITSLAPAAADEVSGAIASWFGGYAHQVQALDAAAASFHADFVQTLTRSALVYDIAEAVNASPLSGFAGGILKAAAATGGTTGGGTTASTATATTGTTTASTNPLTATYAVSSQWNGGSVAGYTITNTGTAPLTNWQLQFTLPQGGSITNLWNGQLTQSGTQVTVTPQSYNGTIAPGGSVNVGFQTAQTGAYQAPTNVHVAGQPVSGTTTGGTTGGTT
ncbi:MAG: cellulose binding domain-containing protein, partial [Mycobacterium sp.]